MIPHTEVKTFVLQELDRISDAGMLDIFFIILKERGLSYKRVRAAWFQFRDRQYRLFVKEDQAHDH